MKKKKTKFYHFSQNNSGGSFIEDVKEGIGGNVIIEATSAEEANEKALDIGIYFDGVKSGWDCECCGDRWYPVNENDGYNTPSIYGEDAFNYESFLSKLIFIHYDDGSFVRADLREQFNKDLEEIINEDVE